MLLDLTLAMAIPRYIALIGDLVGSRDLEASVRGSVQSSLSKLFTETAGVSGQAAQPLLTLGDEFQGLFHVGREGASAAMALMLAVQDRVRPTGVRFGLGAGELATALEPKALGMDGPCFHRARDAVEQARTQGGACRLCSGSPALDRLWGALAGYALTSRQGWSDLQWEAITRYEKIGAWNRVAAELGISRSAVTLRHQAAGWDQFTQSWTALRESLPIVVEQEDSNA